MSDRLLKVVSIVDSLDGPFLNGLSKLEEVEIWTDRSKVINKHIQSISKSIKFVAIVDPKLTPVWAIIDKPYDVYTANETTLESLQHLLNYSDIEENTVRSSILTEVSKEIYILFYIEKVEDKFVMKCLLLDISLSKLNDITSKELPITDKSIFIDEISKKDDLIDSLMKQPILKSNLNSKKQVELAMKEQQMQRIKLRQDFKMIISKEVKKRMNDKPKASQNEVAEICLKAMTFKFKGTLELDNQSILDVQKWLSVFLNILGVSPKK